MNGFAQTAEFFGTVRDASGAVVEGAAVAVVNEATHISRSAVTNSNGAYTIPFLTPGTYGLTVKKDGFRSVVRSNLVLTIGESANLDLALEVGSVNDSVTVSGDTSLVKTDSAAVGTTIDHRFVENMPLNGRSINALLLLSPGIVLTPANNNNLWGQFSVNGQRQGANYFTVDGVSANYSSTVSDGPYGSTTGQTPAFDITGGTIGLVSIDALQEFRIETSTYAPEFGRMPGAQVSLLTRSGANQFHGTAYDYFRNEKLDATDWFIKARSLPKPALRQNDFGGVFGGPIVKDRTFFFFSQESLRARQPGSAVVEVPTLEARAMAPSDVRPYLNAFPKPNGQPMSALSAAFLTAYSNPISIDSTSLRVDHQLSSKVSLFGRFSRSPSKVKEVQSAMSNLEQSFNSYTGTAGATILASPTVNDVLRFNWSRSNGIGFYSFRQIGDNVAPPSGTLLSATRPGGLDGFGFGSSSYRLGSWTDNYQRQINLVNTLSITRGSHLVKTGVDYRYLYPTSGGFDFYRAPYFYSTDVTALQTGTPYDVYLSAGVQREVQSHNLSIFGQDTWRLSPSLTITYGIRWEFNPPPTNRDDKPVLGLKSGASPALMRAAPLGSPYYQTTYTSFAPRIGLAWRPGNSSKTVLRSGFGVFYDLPSGGAAVGFLPWGAPYGHQVTMYGVPFNLSDPVLNTKPAPESNPPYDNVWTADPNLKTPYTLQWNFALQREFLPGQSLTLSYVASVGRQLLIQNAFSNPNPDFVNLWVTQNGGNSSYHSFQAQYQRRLSHGLQAIASYSWSHSIDIGSTDTGWGRTTEAIVRNLSYKGPSDFDIRHSATVAVSYDIPSPVQHGAVAALLRNWSADTFFRASSAPPLEIWVYQLNSYLRPDLVSGVPLYLDDPHVPGGRKINPAAFVIPTPARQGNLGRNALRGFGMWQADLSLRRQVPITERFGLQIRADAYNLLNHPNFGPPTGYYFPGYTQFGIAQSMYGRSLGSGSTGGFSPLYQVGGPRSMQVALKLIF
jgi:hypothetical protein